MLSSKSHNHKSNRRVTGPYVKMWHIFTHLACVYDVNQFSEKTIRMSIINGDDFISDIHIHICSCVYFECGAHRCSM